jgi:hypothetical protein
MPIRRYKPEEVVTLLRQIEVAIANGKTTPQACKEAEITIQTYYRWRKEFGGLKLEQAKKMKDLEKENARLKSVVSSCYTATVTGCGPDDLNLTFGYGTPSGPQYQDAQESDTFVLSGAEDLVPSLLLVDGSWKLITPRLRRFFAKPNDSLTSHPIRRSLSASTLSGNGFRNPTSRSRLDRGAAKSPTSGSPGFFQAHCCMGSVRFLFAPDSALAVSSPYFSIHIRRMALAFFSSYYRRQSNDSLMFQRT